MKLKQVEIIKTQAESLGVEIETILVEKNSYVVHIGKHSYYKMNSALNALTTMFLRQNKGK